MKSGRYRKDGSWLDARLESFKEADCLEDLGVDWKIILKWILNKVGRCGLDSRGSGCSPVAGSSGHSN